MGIEVEADVYIEDDGGISIPALYHKGSIYTVQSVKDKAKYKNRSMMLITERTLDDISRSVEKVESDYAHERLRHQGEIPAQKTNRELGEGFDEQGVYQGPVIKPEGR
jgi:hypothetical protein